MVCAYLSKEVAQIHGSAQVAGQTSHHVTTDMDTDKEMEELMEEAAELVAGVI